MVTRRNGYCERSTRERFGESAATNCCGVTDVVDTTERTPFETAMKALVPALELAFHPKNIGSVQPAVKAKRSWGIVALIAAMYATGRTMSVRIKATTRKGKPFVPHAGLLGRFGPPRMALGASSPRF
jgi:hypothetical protein